MFTQPEIFCYHPDDGLEAPDIVGELVLAIRAIANTEWHIMFNHLLPNVASIVIVDTLFEAAGAILVEARLSYLGVGIGPPLASWGNMMQGSLGNFTDSPCLVLTPGILSS